MLKNIHINYDLPQKWVSALKMSNLNIGFSCDNVFTACARAGMNPQTWGGGQSFGYGTARVYSFQLTAKF